MPFEPGQPGYWGACCGARPPAVRCCKALRGTRVTYLQWVNFVPAHDAALKKQIAEFEKESGIKVALETINMNAHPGAHHRGH